MPTSAWWTNSVKCRRWTNRVKFSVEAAYLFEALNRTIVEPSQSLGWLPSDEPGQYYYRAQAQFGF